MSRTAPTHPNFRPQPIATAEIDRSHATTTELLQAPADWLRRVHCARLNVFLDAPMPSGGLSADDLAVLEQQGFKALCTAWVRHPAPTERIERRVDVWVDPTTTIRAEVIGGRVYLNTLFDDGTSLVSMPDPTIAEWVRSSTCDVLCGTNEVRRDLAAFRSKIRDHAKSGRSGLLCANRDAYRLHLRLATLHGSKRPPTSVRLGEHGLLYPMTPVLAAEFVARRDAHRLPGR